jgi:type VI secretion system protein ImpA
MNRLQQSKAQLRSFEFDQRFLTLEAAWARYDEHIDDPRDADTPLPDATACLELAASLLGETPDLRVAIWALRSSLLEHGLASLATSLQCIHHILADHGDQAQPSSEDDLPGSGHALALAWLASNRCLREVSVTPLCKGSSLVLADILGDTVKPAAADCAPHYDTQAWVDAVDCLRRVEENVNARAHDSQLDTRNLRTRLASIQAWSVRCWKPTLIGVPVPDVRSADWPGENHQASQPTVRTRASATADIAAAIDYFDTHEPSHPAPLLLRRALRTIGMDFTALIAELAPEASQAIARISGDRNHETT